MSKYMNDYNYHDWSKFMVRSIKEKPSGTTLPGAGLQHQVRVDACVRC